MGWWFGSLCVGSLIWLGIMHWWIDTHYELHPRTLGQYLLVRLPIMLLCTTVMPLVVLLLAHRHHENRQTSS
jgi:hypothetical protein